MNRDIERSTRNLQSSRLYAKSAPSSARVADARANPLVKHGSISAGRHANGSVLRDDGDGEHGESHRGEENKGGFEEHAEDG
jgi:hypothetical protein